MARRRVAGAGAATVMVDPLPGVGDTRLKWRTSRRPSGRHGASPMPHFVCVTCGTQFAASDRKPDGCPICQDERQYVGPGGQQWTTLDGYATTHTNVFAEAEPGLHTIHPRPKAGIGQRAFL